MFKLEVLTAEGAGNLACNLWNRTLKGARRRRTKAFCSTRVTRCGYVGVRQGQDIHNKKASAGPFDQCTRSVGQGLFE